MGSKSDELNESIHFFFTIPSASTAYLLSIFLASKKARHILLFPLILYNSLHFYETFILIFENIKKLKETPNPLNIASEK